MHETILRKRAVLALTGMGATWLHMEVKAKRFPQPVQIGQRAIGWKKSEVEQWLKSREAVVPTPAVERRATHDMPPEVYRMYRALHNAVEFLTFYFTGPNAEENRDTEGMINMHAEAMGAVEVANHAIRQIEKGRGFIGDHPLVAPKDLVASDQMMPSSTI